MKTEQFYIKDHDDFLAAAAYRPAGAIKACAVFVHAYSNWKDEHDYMFCRMANALADNQTASLLFDMRGHGESAGLLEDATFETMCKDIAKAAAYAKKEICPDIYIITAGFSARLCAEAVGNDAKGYVLLSPAVEIPEELRFLAAHDGEHMHTVLAAHPERAAAEKAMEQMGMLPRFVTAETVSGDLFACKRFSGTPVSVRTLVFGSGQLPEYGSIFPNSSYCEAKGGGVLFRSPAVIEQMTEQIGQFIESN